MGFFTLKNDVSQEPYTIFYCVNKKIVIFMLMNFYWRKNKIQNIFAIGNITLKLTVNELASTQRI